MTAISAIDSRPSVTSAADIVKRPEIAAAPGRVPGLDGLRALSIMVVQLGHLFLPEAGGVAALGVYIFFAISGFLITRLLYLELKQTNNVNIPKFYLRRLLRLYPVLLMYLLVVCSLDIVVGASNSSIEILGVLFYFLNYLMSYDAMHGQTVVMQVGVMWSLAVEEHFYLLMPLFFVAFRGRIRPMIWLAAILCLVPLLLRITYVVIWPDIVGKLVTYMQSETRFDSIAVGVLLAVLCETKWRARVIAVLASPVALAIGVAMMLLAPAVPGPLYRETLKFTLVSLGTLPLIASVVFGTKVPLLSRVANLPAVVWIGKLSYSFYIWPGCTSYLVELSGFKGPLLVTGLLKLTLGLVVAACSYYWLEKPIARWRERLK